MAFECNEEKLKAQPSVIQYIDELLEKGIEDPDLSWRRVIAEALLTRSTRQMIHLHEDIYIDTSLVTCAEYQVFLDEQRAKGNFHQPDHWKTYTFASGQGHVPVLGVRSSDAIAFCAWLTEHDREGWFYRLPTNNEHKKLVMDRSTSGKLVSDTGYWIEDGKGFAWGTGTPPPSDDINGMIQELTNHDRTRSRAFTCDLDFDVAYDISHDTILTSALDLAFVRDLDLDFGLDLDLVRVLVRASALDLNLARAITYALFLRGFDFAAIFTLKRGRPLNIDDIPDNDLDRVLDVDLDRVFDHRPGLVLDLNLALAYSLAHDLTHALARLHTHPALFLARDLTSECDLTRGLHLVHNFVRNLTHDLDRNPANRSIELMNWEFSHQNDKVEFLRWSIRYLALVHARSIRYASITKMRSIERLLWKRNEALQDTTIFENAIKNHLDLHVSLALLELRIQGKIPAWEGILLVKERKLKD